MIFIHKFGLISSSHKMLRLGFIQEATNLAININTFVHFCWLPACRHSRHSRSSTHTASIITSLVMNVITSKLDRTETLTASLVHSDRQLSKYVAEILCNNILAACTRSLEVYIGQIYIALGLQNILCYYAKRKWKRIS